ncbi:MAG: class I adenylate-forming enzyme family protein, partial [Henriciella sp.]|uniref:AMP-binding protein n=1 Tax=Henriciella sp. TaxID=1968823 RepID=UPI003C7361C3
MHYAELAKARDELTGPGGQFEIVKENILGNTIRTFKNAPPSIREFWLSTAPFAERDYLVYKDERISYAEAHRLTASIAAWLFDRGVAPGDRVAISMRNYPEWLLIYWACASVGVTVVGMNAWWTAEEMSYALKDSSPKVLFADQERLARVHERPAMVDGIELVGVRLDGPEDNVIAWSDVVVHEAKLPDVTIDPDSDACIFYTSGTTGFPKGAQLTHRGCIANLMNLSYARASAGLAVQVATGEVPPDPPPVPHGLITTPLFHVTANNCGAYAVTAVGGKIVLMYKWDAGEALRLIESEKITSMSGVPVMAREVLNHPDFKTTDTSS